MSIRLESQYARFGYESCIGNTLISGICIWRRPKNLISIEKPEWPIRLETRLDLHPQLQPRVARLKSAAVTKNDRRPRRSNNGGLHKDGLGGRRHRGQYHRTVNQESDIFSNPSTHAISFGDPWLMILDILQWFNCRRKWGAEALSDLARPEAWSCHGSARLLRGRRERTPYALLQIRGFKRTRALVGKVPASAGTHRENQATVALTILPGARGGSPLGRASICSIPLST